MEERRRNTESGKSGQKAERPSRCGSSAARTRQFSAYKYCMRQRLFRRVHGDSGLNVELVELRILIIGPSSWLDELGKLTVPSVFTVTCRACSQFLVWASTRRLRIWFASSAPQRGSAANRSRIRMAGGQPKACP